MTEVTMKPVANSALIAEDGWDQELTTLYVKFKSGLTYKFAGLSPDIHDAYERSESKGKFLKRSIEPNVTGVRV